MLEYYRDSLKPSETSKIERFAKIVNGFNKLFLQEHLP